MPLSLRQALLVRLGSNPVRRYLAEVRTRGAEASRAWVALSRSRLVRFNMLTAFGRHELRR